MALFSRKDNGSKGRDDKVVVTGKRVDGIWMMESTLRVRPGRARRSGGTLQTRNRSVRTVH